MLALTHPGPDRTELSTRDAATASRGHIVVSVHASGLNRADLLQRAGKYPAPPGWPADIPGLEYAGEVAGVGEGVVRWRRGDRVMGLVGGGAHAESLVVHENEAMPIPAGIGDADAAAIPEAFLTAWDALTLRGRAQPGERVLVHAIGSGVGTAAAQLGRALGFHVIGTSRSAQKLDRARGLGMQHGVLTTESNWPALIGGPVDVIVDTLGAAALESNLGLLAPRGRMVVLGTMTGARASAIELGMVLRKRLEIIGTAMRVRSLDERTELVRQFESQVLPMFADGRLKPVVDSVVPAREFEQAYHRLEANANFGKVVLEW